MTNWARMLIYIYAGRIDQKRIGEEDALNNEYEGLEKVIKEMRREFNAFLSKWM